MKALKRILGQEGINGVIVALLLILIGVGALMGISTWLNDASNTVIQDANGTINTISATN